MKFLQQFWPKKQDIKEQNDLSTTTKKSTYVDIIISLNTDKQIDFSLFVDDQIHSLPIDPIEYIGMCSDFLSVVLSDYTKKDAISILDQQIKNNNNKFFIESVIQLLKSKQKEDKTTSKHTSFIKPSEVFARYTV